jgi:ferredoxin-NADP reductase
MKDKIKKAEQSIKKAEQNIKTVVKKNILKVLKPQAFLQISKIRQKIIKLASDAKLPDFSLYSPNTMAKALHPRQQFLVISEVIDHHNGYKSFVFLPDLEAGTSKLAFAAAGQYISFTLKIGDSVVSRPYSLSSSPKDSLEGKYMVTIKRIDGGFCSNYMIENWKEGTKVVATAPQDVLVYDSLRDAKTVVGVAGGSGITPFYSMAQAIADGDEDFNLVLLYGTRNLSDVVFLDELKALEKKCDKIKVINVFSDEESEADSVTIDSNTANTASSPENLIIEKGFITADIIKKYAPADSEYSVFMCGPEVMYHAVDKECENLGIKKKFIRHGANDEYKNPELDEAYDKKKIGTYSLTVRIHGEEQTIPCASNESLLIALERAGITVQTQCRRGTCGWCHSKLVSGDVFISPTYDKRRQADKEYGYVDPCCTFPMSDVELYLE